MVWSFFSQNIGTQFPYTQQEEVGADNFSDLNVFRLYDGISSSKGDAQVSIFVCDTPSLLPYAKAAVQRLKTLRHPCILNYLESYETDKVVYLATERVTPLLLHLERDLNPYPEVTRNHYIAYGIYGLTKALSFLASEAKLKHNNIQSASVFVNAAGDWKLGGLEYVTPSTESNPPRRVFPTLSKYDPPEMESMGQSTDSSLDAWGFGCLIWEMFNGPLSSKKALSRLENIPKDLCSSYMELVASNPRKRPSPKELHDKLQKSYFKNDIIETVSFLEELQIRDENEKSSFYNGLPSKIDNIPLHVCNGKILPHLINAFEFGNAGCAILSPLFKLGKNLSPEEYQTQIVPCVIKLFASPDRYARFKLLSQIEHFIEHLSNKIVNNQVFTQIVNGFVDREPIIREKTVIAIIHLAPKLNFSNLDEKVVLMNFSRLLRDEVPGIRTNTTVCLGKIAPHLNAATRQKVLIGAFASKLKDPFSPARIAALNAFVATQEYYSTQDLVSRILPVISMRLIDPEKSVRDQAFKIVKGIYEQLEKKSEDPDFSRLMEKEMESTTVVSAATDWASWAVGTLGAKFSKPAASTSKSPGESPKSPPSPQMSNSQSSTTSHKEAIVSSREVRQEREDSSILSPDTTTPVINDGWDDDDDWKDFEVGDEEPNVNTNTIPRVMSTTTTRSRAPISHSAFSEMVIEDTSDWSNGNDDGWESFDPLHVDSKKKKDKSPPPPRCSVKKKPITSGGSSSGSTKAGPLKLGAKKC